MDLNKEGVLLLKGLLTRQVTTFGTSKLMAYMQQGRLQPTHTGVYVTTHSSFLETMLATHCETVTSAVGTEVDPYSACARFITKTACAPIRVDEKTTYTLLCALTAHHPYLLMITNLRIGETYQILLQAGDAVMLDHTQVTCERKSYHGALYCELQLDYTSKTSLLQHDKTTLIDVTSRTTLTDVMRYVRVFETPHMVNNQDPCLHHYMLTTHPLNGLNVHSYTLDMLPEPIQHFKEFLHDIHNTYVFDHEIIGFKEAVWSYQIIKLQKGGYLGPQHWTCTSEYIVLFNISSEAPLQLHFVAHGVRMELRKGMCMIVPNSFIYQFTTYPHACLTHLLVGHASMRV